MQVRILPCPLTHTVFPLVCTTGVHDHVGVVFHSLRKDRSLKNLLRPTIVVAASAAALFGLATPVVADDVKTDSAICDTSVIVQTGKYVNLKSRPSTGADTIGSSHKGTKYTCSSVESGVEHSHCGSQGSPSWIVIDIYFDDADNSVRAYAPSSCFADVY